MNTRDRRAVLYGAAVVVSAWILLRGAPAGLRALQQQRLGFEQRRALLQESWSQLMSLDHLEDSAKVLRRAIVGMAPRILSGNSPELALNDLAGRLNDRATRHHAKVLTVAGIPDSASAGQLRRVSAQVTLEGDFRGIVGVLRAVAADSLVLVVDHLQIEASAPLAPASEAERLTAQLQLRSWFLAR